VNPSSSGGGGGNCTVNYTIAPQSSSQFGGTISIVNNGSSAISSWTLTWTFANGQTIVSLWNANESQSGSTVTLTSESYNANIPAGGTLTGIGFNGNWNGSTNSIPSSFTLNGSSCTVN
jgi:cellulase/cellobiase CelA1